MGIKIDLIGKTFGRLLVIKEVGRDKQGSILWKCQCRCGNITIANGSALKSGRKRSCGCLVIEARITHGMTKTPTYRSWRHMLDRCNNPKNNSYSHYGGRGIFVCKEWLGSFETFLKDMGERPERPKGLSIERLNNNDGYSPSNCVWASRTDQMRNQRIHKRNKTGTKGVWWDKRQQKYSVQIGVNKKSFFLGHFTELPEAIATRQRAEQKYWEGGS